jgi:short-subunit dehydrogenase
MPNQIERTKTALITGASSGIGLELAKLFAQARYNLVLVARKQQSLAEISKELEAQHGISARIIPKDLSDTLAAQEIYEELQRETITVDALVNCAGFGASGFFSETDWSREMSMLQVNVVALTHLTRLFLDGMLQRKDGKVLNVASTAAFQPGPLMAVYYATKAYVLSFTEALEDEVRNSGVTVSALCPGPTRTRFQEISGMTKSRLYGGAWVMDAGTVARIGYQGLMSNKRVIIPGLRNRLLAFAVRLTPRNFVAKIARRMNERA